MAFLPTVVNGLVTDHTSLRLSVESGWDDTIMNIISISSGDRMTRELIKSNHPIGYGFSLGQYSTETLKVVVPQEQYMDFISRQGDGYGGLLRQITVTWISRNSRQSDVEEFFDCLLTSQTLSSSGDQTGPTTREIEFLYKYKTTNGVCLAPIDADNFVATTSVTLL
jgi:hypothetical protein